MKQVRLNMNKSLLKKILIWFSAILIILLIVGYFAMNYAVNRMLDSFSPVSDGIEQQITQSPTSNSTPKDPTSTVIPSEKNGLIDVSPTTQMPEQKTIPKPSPTSSPFYTSDISADKANAVKDNITIREKSLVMSVLLKKLSSEDIKVFLKMSNGGLTDAEKGEAKKVIIEKLTEEEYNQLIEIAAKYGLSQGEKIKK